MNLNNQKQLRHYAKAGWPISPCAICGAPFQTRPGINRPVETCSQECGRRLRKSRITIKKPCATCGKDMVGTPSTINEYCCASCAYIGRSKKNGVARNCVVCGGGIEEKKKRRTRCAKCRHNYRISLVKQGELRRVSKLQLSESRRSATAINGPWMAGYNSELSAVAKYDETKHWLKHPEVAKWKRRKKFEQGKVSKSNYYLSKILRSRIYCVLKGLKKSEPTLRLLGCSIPHFRRHLESRFCRGMRWENYGTRWHIDHKEPCASFDLSKPDQQRRCFHYSNLQPMLARENLKKHATIIPTQRELLLSI